MMEFIVIVESDADARTATELAERVLREQGPEWLEDYLKYQIRWAGLKIVSNCSTWKELKDIAQFYPNHKVPRYRRSKTVSKFDGASADKVLTLISTILKKEPERSIGAALLIRDLDGREQGKKRLASLHQARQNHQTADPDLAIVIGAAIPKREAWVLNGFVPQTAQEKAQLAELKQQLKFDPCVAAHRLRGDKKYPEQRDRDAKVILEILTNDDSDRERQCWAKTDLAVLRDRGIETGLTDYLQDIDTRLRPILR
ncbi:MAG: hypothetical protein AAGG51_21585 [Cyanobacteria bacterium P01_G01_bin.54]